MIWKLSVIILLQAFSCAISQDFEFFTPATSNCSASEKEIFEKWKILYKKSYSSEEEEIKARENFCINLVNVETQNGEEESTYVKGTNEHSDKSTQDKNENLLGIKRKSESSKSNFKVSETFTTSGPIACIPQTSTTITNGEISTTFLPTSSVISTLPATFSSTIQTSAQRTTLSPLIRTRTTTRNVAANTKTGKTLKSGANSKSTTATTRKIQNATTKKNLVMTTKSTTKTISRTTTKRATSRSSMLTTRQSSSTSTLQKTTLKSQGPDMLEYRILSNSTPPCSVNYTENCSPIKDQYGCGACWSFAATGVAEFWRTIGRKSNNLSDQNIIDCNNYGDDCSGGWPLHAFYHMKSAGVADGEAYPYVQEKRACQASQYPPIIKVPNACEVELKGDENRLMRIVAQYGPVVSVIYVISSMYQYKGGVFFEGSKCPNYIYNHAIIIVGYGTDSEMGDYWIIKNSWGTSWGMNGYGWMARNRNNHCAIATYAIFPC